ncbi:Eukaryotic translation initiation factor 3 subunit M [Choanephora cucurbitarum]|uniref:Eukaryotic translation initiation factor 3 subunit M n=1 Tax=Choanephora cucurbitarum TaxID=101091 RepID=A0A1C7NKT3_9FUNG|nr:Eukaryotic translation initiation factor 3 subunit M [Choanephora cucurbitarum]
MSINNIFVQGGAESQIIDLAIYISKLRDEEGEKEAPYVKHIESILKSDKKDAVYAEIAKDASILLTEGDREVEGAFNLLIVTVLNAPEAVLSNTVQLLVDTLTKTESNKISLKQKILLNLYNALPGNSPIRYHAFVGLVEATSQAEELESLYGQLEYVDAWAKQWGIDQSTQRELYNYLSQVLLKAGEEKLALDFSLKTLVTLGEDKEAEKLAKDIVRRAIAMENYFAFEDLVQYTAIQKLKGTPEYELLDIFLNGTLSTYQAFEKANGSVIDHAENNTHKIRLLSLASLGSENLSRELTYAEIANSLQIPVEEVEMWVIDVIRAGLVEAKLDQLNKTVIVHRSIYRVFGKEQWKKLSTSLSAWKENLNEILAVIGNAKLIAGGALQGQSSVVVETTDAK